MAQFFEGGGKKGSRLEGGNYELVELEQRHGFGFAVRRALFHHVHTPLVIVVQHDRTFCRSAQFLEDIVVKMLAEGEDGCIGYVLLPITSTNKYSNQWQTKLGQVGIKGREADLTRFTIMLDKKVDHAVGNAVLSSDPHRCSENAEAKVHSLLSQTVKQQIRRRIGTGLPKVWIEVDTFFPAFGGTTLRILRLASSIGTLCFQVREKLVKHGGFIEDKLGQAQSKDVLTRGLDAAVPAWKMWLYQDGLEGPSPT